MALKYVGRVAQAQDTPRGFSGQIPAPLVQRYTIEGRIPSTITIRSCGLKTRTGSVICSVTIDGITIPGLTNIAGSSTTRMTVFEALPWAQAITGQVLGFDILAAVGATDLDVSVHYGDG